MDLCRSVSFPGHSSVCPPLHTGRLFYGPTYYSAGESHEGSTWKKANKMEAGHFNLIKRENSSLMK